MVAGECGGVTVSQEMEAAFGIFSSVGADHHTRAFGHVNTTLKPAIVSVACAAVHVIANDPIANSAVKIGKDAVAFIAGNAFRGINFIVKDVVVLRQYMRHFDALHVVKIIAQVDAVGVNYHPVNRRVLPRNMDANGSIGVRKQNGVVVNVVVHFRP